MYVGVLPAHVYYTMCIPSALRGQDRPSDPLGLEFQMIVSLHVSSGNQPSVLWRTASALALFFETVSYSVAPAGLERAI